MKLNADVDNYKIIYESLKEVSSVPISEKILNPKDKIAAMIHEIVHSELHSETSKNYVGENDRYTKEIQAEGTAYVVCACIGVESQKTSFPYLASYSKGQYINVLVKNLDIIQKSSHQLIEKIESKVKEKTLEQNQEKDSDSKLLDKENRTSVIEKIDSLSKDPTSQEKNVSVQTTKER